MTIYGAMNTAKVSLLTHQLSLDVTANNIANVNNPDYTRQAVNLEAAFPLRAGGSPGLIGMGVRATSVTRFADQFLEGQRLDNKSLSGYWDSRSDFLERLEVVFNESSEKGLNNILDQFFLSWRNLAFNARGLTERTDTIAQGRNVGVMFNKINKDMQNLRNDLDSKVVNSVSEINRLTTEVARLNSVIHETEVFNVSANDLRDKREKAIRGLADYVDVTVVEDSNNQVMVSISGGRPLVIGSDAFTLSTQVRSDDPQASDVFWNDLSGGSVEITSEISGGTMGGWLKMRDTDLPGYLDKLDLLSATMMRDTNVQHSQGYGLDGSTGVDFFSGLNVGVSTSRDNTGAATIGTGTIVNQEKVNLHKFEVTYNGGNISIQDLTNGTTVATEAYVSGGNVAYLLTQGIQVAITGAATNGDKFTVNAAAGSALGMKVNQAIINDSAKVAAGLTTDPGAGDNALLIAQTQDNASMNKTTASSSGTATFAEFYNAIVGDVGIKANTANTISTQQESIVFELENRHEQIAGVSLDEEMVNLIKFQHAYQASARLISVIDELLQTLVSLGR